MEVDSLILRDRLNTKTIAYIYLRKNISEKSATMFTCEGYH